MPHSKSDLKKMQENYNHVLQLPIVKKLNKKDIETKKRKSCIKSFDYSFGRNN